MAGPNDAKRMPGTLLLVAFAFGLLVIIGAVAVGYGMAAYNRLLAGRNRVREGRRDVEASLKRRADLVPDLVEMVKSRAALDEGLLETVLELRRRSLAEVGQTRARARAEDDLTAAIGRLVASADPVLAGDPGYRRLRDTLAEIEDQLEQALGHHNGAVQRLNAQVEVFPSNIVAGILGIAPADTFELAGRAVPEIAAEP